MLKYLALFACIAVSIHTSAQKINGTVVDKSTQEPLAGALVSSGSARVFTNTFGRFEIVVPAMNDSLKIVHFAYKPYTTAIRRAIVILRIELVPAEIQLGMVTVRGSRNFKKDSIENRIAYAKQFNYKGPTVMDAFSGNLNKQPGELISVNPLLLIAALTKKSTPEYKFHQKIINDEQADYVDRKFNRGIVSRVTRLKGDTLAGFLIRYRPTYLFAKKATDYDMEVYIKKSYQRFRAEGFPSSNPFAKP
jgi:hypothetical protein